MKFTIAVLLAVSGLSGCQPAGEADKQGPKAMQLATIKPRRKTIARTVRQPGQIEAFQQAPLYAKVPGYVRRFLVDIGDPVKGPCHDESGGVTKRGQLLAEVAIPELTEELGQKRALVDQAKAEVAQARAAVKVARAALKPAEAQVEQALANQEHAQADYAKWESEYKRVVKLAESKAINSKLVDEVREALRKSDAGRRDAASRKDAALAAIDQIEAAIEKTEADEAAALARQEVAEADQARVKSMADYQRIEAPFDGTVSQRNVDVGHFVQPAQAAQARPLYVVVQTDVVRVFVDVPETEATLVDRGDRAVLRIPSRAGQEFSGEVARTSWTLDATTRTLRTEIDVPNASGQLRPGMYVDATIVLEQRNSVMALPLSAVRAERKGSSCFVIRDGKLARQTISLGLSDGSDVEVTGLSGDETVVERATAGLEEGQPAEPAAAAP